MERSTSLSAVSPTEKVTFWHKNVSFGGRFWIYIYRFRIYTGKEDPMTSVSAVLRAECQRFGISEKIVVYLALPLYDCGYTLDG